MKYEKLTPDAFKKKLKDGEYAHLGGARRAIGKFQGWKEKEREWARAEAEKHFGGTGQAAGKTKKAAKKKAKKAVAKTAGKKPGRKAKVKRQLHPNVAARLEKARAAKAAKHAAAQGAEAPATPAPAKKKTATKAKSAAKSATNVVPSELIHRVQEEVSVATSALAGLKVAKDMAEHLVDVKQGAQICADILQAAVSRLHAEINNNNQQIGASETSPLESAEVTPPPVVPTYQNSAPPPPPVPSAVPPMPPTPPTTFAGTVVASPPVVTSVTTPE